MNFELSIHVYERLEERDIPIQILQILLETPEQILVQEDGTKVYQSRFLAANGKTYLLRAFINDSVDPPRVKSLYKTSKLKKYWREGDESNL
ncbi:hypothetical protein [Gloeocapsopsis sp. IPPAS B-1203]|uniref:hypothetical protein n=1 Tax=Gloeocapsopsis sp. IPPAS B-1203 TaxID=2049454 RepID=UPI000C18036C|nr:hypothetical protein [Gloeocapsopsis sp. IPPAS B-1203]PIG93381.1 hypothetical protein CSQ79_10600 [Gloeocapsopsis sp. IPPAS B-1203]